MTPAPSYVRVDLSGAEAFCDYLQGRRSAAEVLGHPAYRTVRRHSQLLRDLELTPAAVAQGLAGEGPFYGLEGAQGGLAEIRELLDFVAAHSDSWLAPVTAALQLLAPGQGEPEIVVYPIIGYDVGIGLEGSACLNLWSSLYRHHRQELPAVMAHECFHVIYNRLHGVPRLADVVSPQQWLRLLDRMLADEGLATYAGLLVRAALDLQTRGEHPLLEDYRVLEDELALGEHLRLLAATRQRLAKCPGPSRQQRLELVFGRSRITYRAGCQLARLIRERSGIAALQRSVHLDGSRYVRTWGHLVGLNA